MPGASTSHDSMTSADDGSVDREDGRPAFNQEDQPCAAEPLGRRIEALLLANDRPMTDGRIADVLQLADAGGVGEVRAAIEALNAEYANTGRAFRIESVAGGRQILTLPEFGPVLARLHQDRQSGKLTPAAMETLAIVAYRQPILRAEIESIRGVACGEVLRGLLERRLVKIVGRAEEVGRPMLYGTTREFLRVFGLASIEDLPQAKDLKAPAYEAPPSTAEQPEAAEDASASEDPPANQDHP